MFDVKRESPGLHAGAFLTLFLLYRMGGNWFADFDDFIWLVMCELGDWGLDRFFGGKDVIMDGLKGN